MNDNYKKSALLDEKKGITSVFALMDEGPGPQSAGDAPPNHRVFA